jgi:urease accessory protein
MKILGLIFAVATLSFGHTDVLEHGGFMSGFSHPISGLDHILAMIGVGMVAFYAQKVVPTFLAFIGAMILASIAGYSGVALVGVEEGILISIAVVFGLIGFASKLSTKVIVLVIAFFGLFHGFAHGCEFSNGNFIAFMAGFTISTMILHLIGFTVASIYSKKLASQRI